jgi:hypothetical protein
MARSGLTGNFAAIDRLKQKLETAPKVLDVASANMCDEALALVGEGFKRGQDPYGNDWDAPNNLQITGGIRKFARVKIPGHGFKIAATDEKAAWHHNPKPRAAWGGKSLPQRLMVPIKSKGLPAEWETRLLEAGQDAMRAHFRG